MLSSLKNSWFRCYQMGISKKINCPQENAAKEILEQSYQSNEKLINVFNHNVEYIVQNYNFAHNCYLLFDENGILIKSYIPEDLKNISYLHNLNEGVYFTEKSCGTNSVSLAMETEETVCFLGDENYCEFLQKWISIASPIKINNKKAYLCILNSSLNENKKEDLKLVLELLLSKITNDLNAITYPTEDNNSLTEIRSNILKLSANGLTIKQISENLNLSEAAIKYHRNIICQKLCAANIVQAIARSIKMGYLHLDTIH
jgi:transcriptional regulator of acetoin/glycerol metabolism